MIGKSISHYRIVEKLGKGGMGEVYRAEDTTLSRDVAVKVLPDEFTGDPERLARFEREAKVLASLNHPHIASIYGLEQADGKRFLVLELVEGQTLARKILKGPLPVDEALEVCRQIAEGLEAAHEKGIIHRDVKPANIQITAEGKVKILDFGLARASHEQPQEVDQTHSPTITEAMTLPGVMLGTAAYMSPEQAKGKTVDKRADIWAFGCILYEGLTGKAPFAGETVSDLIAKILERDPDWSALPAGTPPRMRALMEKCLRKDPRERLRDIGDARLEFADMLASTGTGLEESAISAKGAAGRLGAPALWIGGAVAAIIGMLLVLAGSRVFGPHAPEPRLRRYAIPVSQLKADFQHPARISPDGRLLLFSSGKRVVVRDLGRFEPQEIAGAEGAEACIWSHDSRRIGYFKNGKIWVSDLAGEHTTPVCGIPAGGGINGADWGPDDTIVFARYLEGLYLVLAAGGEPRLFLKPDTTEIDFHHPQFLPDGRHILAVAHRKNGPNAAIVVSYPEGVRRNLGEFDHLNVVRYAPSGHLFFTYEHGVEETRVVPFSASRLEITGPPIVTLAGGLYPSLSLDGTLCYSLGSSRRLRELVWVDRQGRVERGPGLAQLGLDDPAISPDGRTIVVATYEGANSDLWRLDAARGTRSRLVSGPYDKYSPVWTPDGSKIIYLMAQSPASVLMEIAADGSGSPRRWGMGGRQTITRDGRTIFYQDAEGVQQKIYRLDRTEGATPVMVTANPATREINPALSPDGKWLACLSDEPGSFEVFVRRTPEGTQKRQVSLNGGEWPFWSRDGRALYYWEQGALMEVTVGTGPAAEFGAPKKLFAADDVGVELEHEFRPPACSPAADGRFLMVRRVAGDPTSGILLVENWAEEFRK